MDRNTMPEIDDGSVILGGVRNDERMGECQQFDFSPRANIECCEMCHTGQGGHSLVAVWNLDGTILIRACHPLAERLRALGYLVDEPIMEPAELLKATKADVQIDYFGITPRGEGEEASGTP